MAVVFQTKTVILGLNHLAVGIMVLSVFSACVELLSQHLNEHFASSENEEFLSASTHRG